MLGALWAGPLSWWSSEDLSCHNSRLFSPQNLFIDLLIDQDILSDDNTIPVSQIVYSEHPVLLLFRHTSYWHLRRLPGAACSTLRSLREWKKVRLRFPLISDGDGRPSVVVSQLRSMAVFLCDVPMIFWRLRRMQSESPLVPVYLCYYSEQLLAQTII